ncbi:MAG: glutathione S-transferase [Alphaproteobacteria bacterium]|jgi:glutathione S-transferase
MNNKPPTLYSYNECPFAMRARMALVISDIQCEIREINLKHKPHTFLLLSKKATVPILELSNGLIIDESIDIMRYALSINDPHNWLKCTEALPLVERADNVFMDTFRRYKHPEGYPGESWQTNFELFLSILETALYKNDGYLDESKRFTLKDAAILPLVYKVALLDEVWWQALPFSKTQIWFNQFKSSGLLNDIMTKHPVWKENHSRAEWLLAS